MKVKLDENLPTDLLDDLRAAGHEADTVHFAASMTRCAYLPRTSVPKSERLYSGHRS